jgi:hypothetical protein
MWSCCSFNSAFICIILWSICCCHWDAPYTWVFGIFCISPVRMSRTLIRWLILSSSRWSETNSHGSTGGGSPSESEEWTGCHWLDYAHLCYPHSAILLLQLPVVAEVGRNLAETRVWTLVLAQLETTLRGVPMAWLKSVVANAIAIGSLLLCS